jgi:hypothetical protein
MFEEIYKIMVSQASREEFEEKWRAIHVHLES